MAPFMERLLTRAPGLLAVGDGQSQGPAPAPSPPRGTMALASNSPVNPQHLNAVAGGPITSVGALGRLLGFSSRRPGGPSGLSLNGVRHDESRKGDVTIFR